MAWVIRFFIFLPLFIIFVVFGNDRKSAKIPESKKNSLKSQVIGTGKVLVEVTDAIEDEEEEEEALVYTPSIAPATPQVLSSSKYIQHDVPTLSEDIKNGKPRAVVNEIKSNSSEGIAANKAASEDVSAHTSPMTIAPSSSSVAATLSTSLPPMPPKSSPKKEESHAVLKINNEKLNLNKNENINKQSEQNYIDQHHLPSEEKRKEEKHEVAVTITNDNTLKDVDINISTENKNETESPAAGNADEPGSVNLTRENDKADDQKKDQDELLKKDADGEGVLKDGKVSSTQNKQLDIEPVAHENVVPKPSPDKRETQYDEKTEIKVVEIKGDDKQESEKQQDGPVITSMEKPDEDGEVAKGKGEKKMLSFAEWKKEKEEDTINQTKLQLPKDKPILKKKNKIKKNFASIDCGGKVIAANEEASNILSVLKEDKDIYMLNPCNVKAWFIVELCDRIQVDSIDLANFEMFSSTPEKFNVYVTSRYPSGSWEKVDTFHAKPEKQVQTFVFGENNVFYAKYIKIEIKKYFGNEHYCPLSLLRVFGITEVEQFEDSDEPDQEDVHHDDHEATDENKCESNSANIFEAAKNVVAGLVNGMAIKLSGKSNSETNDSSVSESPAVITVTAISNEPAIGEENATRYYKDSFMVGENSVNWEMWYYYHYLKQCPITDPKRFIKKIKATVFFAKNSSSTYFSNQSSTILNNNLTATIVATPDTNLVSKTTTGSNINVSVVKTQVTPSTAQKATPHAEMSITKPSIPTALLDGIPVETSSAKLNTGLTATKSDVETNNSSNSTYIEAAVVTSIDEESADVLHFKVNETGNGAVIAEKIISSSNATSQNVTNENRTSLIDEKKVVAENISLDLINGSHIDKQQKLTNSEHNDTIKSLEQEHNVPSTSQSSIEMEKVKSSKTPPDKVKSNDTAAEIPSNSHMKLNEKKTDNTPEYSVEKDIQANPKTTSGSKESIIAKLNSKVKALEANLTMSMMYLDEMSERYQTAVEKVDERHKKKYFALNVSFNSQQGLINNQSLLIGNLSYYVHEIRSQIQNLTLTTQENHQKLIETHATWVFLEIIFILVFLLVCRRNPKSHDHDKDDEMVNQRRFSEPAMLKNKKVIRKVIEKQNSDPTSCSTDVSNSPLQQSVFQAKKRKRKKSSKITAALEGNANPQSVSAVTERIGPIFGCNWMNGITGAFKRSNSTEKISRQADALIAEGSSTRSFDNLLLRKVKSSELPVIHEDNDDLPRPKSCNDLEYYRKSS